MFMVRSVPQGYRSSLKPAGTPASGPKHAGYAGCEPWSLHCAVPRLLPAHSSASVRGMRRGTMQCRLIVFAPSIAHMLGGKEEARRLA